MWKIFFFITGLTILSLCIIYLSAYNEGIGKILGHLTNSSGYSRYSVNNGTVEIIPSIEAVQEHNQYTKLILGDSVCNQIYDGLQDINNEYCLLGTNRAITLSGQYLLAKEFITNHSDITDIYLIVTLDSFEAYYDRTYGYQYAVMPFVSEDIFNNLDEDTIHAAEASYGKLFLQKNIVKLIDYSAMNRKLYLNVLERYSHAIEGSVSEIAIEYIQKMNQICKENDIQFHLLPTPIKDNEERHLQMERQIKEFKETGVCDLVEEYYSYVTFYPEEQFADGVHLGGIYNEREELNNKIIDLQKKSGQLDDLVLGIE